MARAPLTTTRTTMIESSMASIGQILEHCHDVKQRSAGAEPIHLANRRSKWLAVNS
jgi:hypothetical protein